MQLFIPRKKAIWRIPSLTNYTRKFMVSISEFLIGRNRINLFSRLIGAIEIHLSLGGLSRRQLLQVTFISIVNLQKSKTENNKFGIRNRIQIIFYEPPGFSGFLPASYLNICVILCKAIQRNMCYLFCICWYALQWNLFATFPQFCLFFNILIKIQIFSKMIRWGNLDIYSALFLF